jgi:hypothetical protein
MPAPVCPLCAIPLNRAPASRMYLCRVCTFEISEGYLMNAAPRRPQRVQPAQQDDLRALSDLLMGVDWSLVENLNAEERRTFFRERIIAYRASLQRQIGDTLNEAVLKDLLGLEPQLDGDRNRSRYRSLTGQIVDIYREPTLASIYRDPTLASSSPWDSQAILIGTTDAPDGGAPEQRAPPNVVQSKEPSGDGSVNWKKIEALNLVAERQRYFENLLNVLEREKPVPRVSTNPRITRAIRLEEL